MLSTARRSLRFCLCLIAAPACSQPPAAPAPAMVKAEPVGLYTPAEPGRSDRVGALRFLGGLHLMGGSGRVGGYSGLLVSADGARLLAVSDRGSWLAAELALEDGVPVGVRQARTAPLLSPQGQALSGAAADAEALLRRGGDLLVSFERRHRILRYPLAGIAAPPARLPEPLDIPPALRRQPHNGGMEAMTALADGRLLILSEDGKTEAGHHRAWLLDGPDAAALEIASPPGYSPTDAATLPGGDVLVLYRRYTPLAGVSAILARISAAAVAPDAVAHPAVLARLAPPMTVDNMEGLDVHTDDAGRTLVYMMSDDNFRTVQRTLLLVFALEG